MVDATTYNRIMKEARDNSITNLYVFFRNFWGEINQERYIDNWHIRYLCDYLQEQLFSYLGGREIDLNVIINIPPGTSKSTIISQMFPVWAWLHAPNLVFITTSYNPAISIDNSIRSKAIVKSDKFREFFSDYFVQTFGKPFRLTKDTERDWRNSFGGMRYATATNGVVTGKHANFIIRDDPMSASHVDSKAYMRAAHNFNDRTLSSRMKDKDRTPIYTIMQRLHEDDTTGHELKKKGKVIKHICLPCELSDLVQPAELKEYYTDGLLDPIRLSRSALEKQRIDLGAYAYSGQYEQNPVIEGGNIVKKEWLTTIKQQDFDYIYKREGKPAIHFFVDTAFTEKQTNDPTGIIGAVYMDNKVFIPSAIKVRKEFPELIAFLPQWVKANKYDYRSTIRIEPKANGLSVIQQLKQMTDLNITNTPSPTDSKETRLRSNTGIIECGRFVLVEGAWNEEFIDEVCGFPSKAHDEYVDLTNYAIDYFINDAIEPVDEEQLINDFL